MATLTFNKSTTNDLTEGNLIKKIITYTIPVIISGFIQILFNTADLMVVGKFANDTALASVGATTSLNYMIVCLLLGLADGASACCSKCFGSKDEKGIYEVVHTSFFTALIGGVIVGTIGFIFCKDFLTLLKTTPETINQSTLYLRIIFCGTPFMLTYNFMSAILRSVGDTKRPLYYLLASGVINIGLNVFFVLVLHLDVAGVGLATIISQLISCILVINYLRKVDGPHRLYIKQAKIYFNRLKYIILIGLPAGIQGSIFALSNMIVQKSINTLGTEIVSANTAANEVGRFVYNIMNAFHHTAIAFVGQHIGAKKFKRLKKVCFYNLLLVSVAGIVFGLSAFAFGKQLLWLYSSPETKDVVLKYGMIRLAFMCIPYFIGGLQEVLSGILGGMNKAIKSTITCLFCVCLFRIIWIYTVFEKFKTLESLYVIYPISWTLCVICLLIMTIIDFKRLVKKEQLN